MRQIRYVFFKKCILLFLQNSLIRVLHYSDFNEYITYLINVDYLISARLVIVSKIVIHFF